MITKYGVLKAAVADWIDRTDLTTRIPDVIRMAEGEMYRDLRVRDNEFVVSYNENENPRNPIVLPDNYREMKLVTFDGRPLMRVSDQRFAVINGAGYQGEVSSFCTQERELYLLPWTTDNIAPEDGAIDIQVHYYGTESIGSMAFWNTPTNPNTPPESAGTPAGFTERDNTATTRLFLVNPDMYLFGACYYAYVFLREPPKAAEFRGMFENALNELKSERDQSDYAGSTVAVSNTYGDSL